MFASIKLRLLVYFLNKCDSHSQYVILEGKFFSSKSRRPKCRKVTWWKFENFENSKMSKDQNVEKAIW